MPKTSTKTEKKLARKPTAKPEWARVWTVGVRVWVERNGEAVLGEGRAELLAAIERERSITKAAKAVKISYRKAWSLIQEVNAAAGETLVGAAVGGATGGGARLTERGKLVLAAYESVRRAMHQSAAGALQRAVGEGVESTACVHLAAAISLQEAVGELLAEYALLRPTVRVRAVFGASNELADHVLAGAPCDLFISAEGTEIDRFEKSKRLAAGSRTVVAMNGLTVIGRNNAKPMRRIEELLDANVKTVALAEPACPLGRYSKAYLEAAGIYDELQPKILQVDNSRAVPAAVMSEAAELGIAFTSDAARSGSEMLFRVPQNQTAAKYVAGILRGGSMEVEAEELLKYLSSAKAKSRLRRYGLST